MRRNEMKKKLAIAISTMLAMTTVLSMTSIAFATETEESAEASVSTGIVIDGVIDDWATMRTSNHSDNEITALEFKFAKSEDGSMLYYYFAGPAVTEWELHQINYLK